MTQGSTAYRVHGNYRQEHGVKAQYWNTVSVMAAQTDRAQNRSSCTSPDAVAYKQQKEARKLQLAVAPHAWLLHCACGLSHPVNQ
jgi:hypothetical protein